MCLAQPPPACRAPLQLPHRRACHRGCHCCRRAGEWQLGTEPQQLAGRAGCSLAGGPPKTCQAHGRRAACPKTACAACSWAQAQGRCAAPGACWPAAVAQGPPAPAHQAAACRPGVAVVAAAHPAQHPCQVEVVVVVAAPFYLAVVGEEEEEATQHPPAVPAEVPLPPAALPLAGWAPAAAAAAAEVAPAPPSPPPSAAPHRCTAPRCPSPAGRPSP